jgi:uncharacterized protein with GYD domain
MAKYMIQASYSAEGVRGVLKEGGSSRRATIAELAKNAGGSMEAFYFAFGREDVFVILDLPDNVAAAALSMAVAASGLTRCKVVVLLTPEEIDASTRMKATYRPPGA